MNIDHLLDKMHGKAEEGEEIHLKLIDRNLD